MRPPCTRTPGLLHRGFLVFFTTTFPSASVTVVVAVAAVAVALTATETTTAASAGLSACGGSFSGAVESVFFI